MGEQRYRLDLLEQDVNDTSPLSDRLVEIERDFENLRQDRAESATTLIQRHLDMKLNQYEPFIYLLAVHFNLEELEDLAAGVGVEMEHVPNRGTTVKSQARALVKHLTSRQRAGDLVRLAAQKRERVEDLVKLVDELG